MEYSLDFAERLIEGTLSQIKTMDSDHPEAARASLYMSMLACEISLKSILEKAGFTTAYLKGQGHNLANLLDDFSKCNSEDLERWRPTAIRAQIVRGGTTIGNLLNPRTSECSKYPNEIRYGEFIKHFPPDVMLDCAREVHMWCSENYGHLVKENP